ncbi:MAG: hypothetical protein LDL10_06645, partial [Calditerrivibrio sp.]|nr:hypothetical protein [Calditerrivibrio sp.]
IAAILTDEELQRLSEYGKRLGLSILLEIHTLQEYERVKDLYVDMIGVNSRDLNTFKIDKDNAKEIIKAIDRNRFIVAESGMESAKDIEDFRKAGADAFLIGTFLMKKNDLKSAFEELYRGFINVC